MGTAVLADDPEEVETSSEDPRRSVRRTGSEVPGASTPSETDEAGLECGWAAAGAGAKGAGAENGAESDDASRPSTLVATEVDGAAELSEREEERRAA